MNRQQNTLNDFSPHVKSSKINVDSSIKKISINEILKEQKNACSESLNERRDRILRNNFGFDDFRSKKQRDAVTYVLQSNFIRRCFI